MMSRPVVQILAFVVLSNIGQLAMFAGLVGVGAHDILIMLFLMFSCMFCVSLLVLPDSATEGHKMLTLTYGVAVIYFALASSAGAFAMTDSFVAWYAYTYLYEPLTNNFVLLMGVFTAMELLSAFVNLTIQRTGKAGDTIGRYINFLYSSVFSRIHNALYRRSI